MPAGSSLRDIAARCGVSVSTVSRVLNGKTDNHFSASPQVRDKILAAARAVNYTPNALAKSLKTRKTMQVLIYSLSIQIPFGSSINIPILHYALQTLARQGYSALAGLRLSKEEHMGVNPWLLDGALIIDLQRENPLELDELEAHGIPYVTINDHPGPQGGGVLVDDAGGMRLALDYLIGLGHRKIAYMNPPSMSLFRSFEEAHYSAQQRHEAYVRILTERGLPVPDGHAQTLAAAEVLERQVLAEGVTAVVCYSAEEALTLLAEAMKRGVPVPGRLSIVGFNDPRSVPGYWPGITSVALPARQMGETAADMLVQMMSGGAKSLRVLQEELVIRETTAPPAPGSTS